MRRARRDGAIAGLCFLACGLMVAFVYASQLWTLYAPSIRSWALEQDPYVLWWGSVAITAVLVQLVRLLFPKL